MASTSSDLGTIRLTEYKPDRFHLSDLDRAYLQARFGRRIRHSLQVVDGETWDVLDPGPNVGVLTLPSGRRLESHPKVSVANIFYMMSVAHDLPGLEEESTFFDSFDYLLEFVVYWFAQLAEERIRHGLFRRYVERQDNLGVIRGRILIAQDLRLNVALRHRTYCEFSELSWDIPENQVVRQVANLMAGWSFRPDLRARLVQLDSVMAEITPTRYPASVIDTFTYSRLNYEYQPLHQLCRLLLDASSIHEDEGVQQFQTFLVDMNDLFEKFVARSLALELGEGLRVEAQAKSHLGELRRISIVPDVVLKRGRAAVSVLDTKYKRLVDQGEFVNHDVYQVLAYCTALPVDRGMLVYPRHLVTIDDEVQVRNSPILIKQTTLDLGGSVTELQEAARMLASTVRAWSEP